MKRLPIQALALALTILVANAGAALAAKPTAALTKAAGCSSLVYSWNAQNKARTAEFRIHHFGVFETSRQLSPVGSSGSFPVPADVTFIVGDQYTVLAVLLDAAGRSISPSGAVWWGTC